MKTDVARPIYLKDYTPYPYDVLGIGLMLIRTSLTTVKAVTRFRRKGKEPLVTNGEDLVLNPSELDDVELNTSDYTVYEKRI